MGQVLLDFDVARALRVSVRRQLSRLASAAQGRLTTPQSHGLILGAIAAPLLLLVGDQLQELRREITDTEAKSHAITVAQAVWPSLTSAPPGQDDGPLHDDGARILAAVGAGPLAPALTPAATDYTESLRARADTASVLAEETRAKGIALLRALADAAALSADHDAELRTHAAVLVNAAPELATALARLEAGAGVDADPREQIGRVLAAKERLADLEDDSAPALRVSLEVDGSLRALRAAASAPADTHRATAALDDLWIQTAEQIDEALSLRGARLERQLAGTTLLAALAALLAILLLPKLSRWATAPQQRLLRAMRDLAAPPALSVVPLRHYRNEIGAMARALDAVRDQRTAMETALTQLESQQQRARGREQQTQRILRRALDLAKAGVWSMDISTQTAWASDRVRAILGHAAASSTPDADHETSHLVSPIEAPALHQQIVALCARPSDDDVLQLSGPSGESIWARSMTCEIAPGVFMGVLCDVTDRKREEMALLRAREDAEHANQAKSAFLANMSHEIRTPLNGVLGMAQALSRTPLASSQREMLRVINTSGELLVQILDDVLDMSKIESGQMALEQTVFDVGACVEDVCALFANAAAQKGLTIALSVSRDMPRMRMGDPTRVRQILQNLLSNAVKFTQHGEVRVEASALIDGGVSISVIDTGVGMSDAMRARLFHRFMQADDSITRRFGGTGLGLSIANDLASLMGGRIDVDSIEGVGSRFTFEAPLPIVDQATSPPLAADPNPTRMRILAADDNETNRLVLRSLLTHVGADVHLTHDGQEVVDAASLQAFDVILMDLHMPVLDGLQAAKAIRTGGGPNAASPIVALTADSLASTIAACEAAGIDAHCIKPIVPARLLAAIQSAMEAASAPEAAGPRLAHG